MFKKVLLLGVTFIMFGGTAKAADIPGNVVVLGALDKITGRVSSLNVKIGDTVNFGTLRIKVFSCYYKPPEEAPDNAVFLNITEEVDDKDNDNLKQYFNGWMFSSNPSVSALEHGMYDIWSVECKRADDVVESDNKTAK